MGFLSKPSIPGGDEEKIQISKDTSEFNYSSPMIMLFLMLQKACVSEAIWALFIFPQCHFLEALDLFLSVAGCSMKQ